MSSGELDVVVEQQALLAGARRLSARSAARRAGARAAGRTSVAGALSRPSPPSPVGAHADLRSRTLCMSVVVRMRSTHVKFHDPDSGR